MGKAIRGPVPSRNPAIVVTGCGRSGTLYITKFFKVLGLDIGHEKYGIDGIASWYLPIPNRYNQFYNDMRSHPIVVFHQIRHPLLVISSFYPRKWSDAMIPNLIGAEPGESNLQQKMRYWLWWNQLIEQKFPINYRYKIEDIHRPEVIQNITFESKTSSQGKIEELQNIPTNVHTSYKKTKRSKGYKHIFTWGELWKEDSLLTQQIYEQARRYGYGGEYDGFCQEV